MPVADVSSSAGGRYSDSALPPTSKCDSAFELPEHEYSDTRHSLVSFDVAAKADDGRGPRPGHRESCATDASGFEALEYWTLDYEEDLQQEPEHQLDTNSEDARAGMTPTCSGMMQDDPYYGISIDVNNHSINNQGVVMYHVDIKGPQGLLSTYTIRRRYRAFKNLYNELSQLMVDYAAKKAAASVATTMGPGSFSGVNVPWSPHSQAKPPVSASASLVFPTLPSAGVWSYLKRHDARLVEQRKKRFQEILRIAIRHPATKRSSVLDTFLSVAPSEISQRGSSYVSLQDYSVPVFDRQRESVERKQRKLRVLEGRRQVPIPEVGSNQDSQ